MFSRVVLLGIILFTSIGLFGQTIIGIQDFEATPATPTMTYSGGTIVTGNGLFPTDPKYVSGSRGIQVSNSTTNITFSSVDASAYSSVFFTCRLASFAGTSGNGADVADFVKISVSSDGGTSWSQELAIFGNSNARWSFTSGTESASSSYDGNNTTTNFTPAGGGARTTDGYSSLTITNLPAVATLRVRLEIINNDANEFWVIDDAEIRGTISVPCVAPASQPTNLILSNITASSIDGAFTGTTADGYLVVQSTNSTLSGNPVNGTTYNTGDALGGGTVVYNGTSTSFSATGLSASTTYYFFVFSYNNLSCSGAPAYNTTNPLNNNETTLAPPAFSASVVVSEYYNSADPRDEWIELIVVTDNTDMRNWTLRDNNSSTDAWQTSITFQNIAFWNNMRGGTIIKIWNRQRSSTDATIRTIEVDKNDGYIELYAQHSTYFSGGSFGSDPTWAGNSLNYANGGDLLQLRDASNNHVHALGHDLSPGADWTSCPSPKVLRTQNFTSGVDESVRVIGNNTANYDGGSTTSNTIITIGSTTTSGLANDANNQLLWRTWREPIMAAQTVTGNVCGTNCIDFTWNKMTDPLPTDDVQGYLILRKTALETFIEPVDGTSYATLGTLGDATVVANLDNPTAGATVSYIDNLAELGTDEYRIYAYRYSDDNINGNSFDLARGRAYNTTDYVTVTLSSPLPIELLSFTGKSIGSSNLLEWETTTEINNDYFTLERSSNATHFSELGTMSGAGNSNTLLHYQFTDNAPLEGVNYYRLKQTDFDGRFSYSNIVALSNKTTAFSIWNSAETLFIKGDNENSTSSLKIYNLLGELVLEKYFQENITINTTDFSSGIYLVKIQSNENLITQKVKF
ncbi:MAG: T9SS type A sorting domain-containing protein [Flavobacteriales bacterium]|nr:T9SS type A sorting domain-containing protein [Flavobacteriales bacterium]